MTILCLSQGHNAIHSILFYSIHETVSDEDSRISSIQSTEPIMMEIICSILLFEQYI